jgi:Glycosyl transferase family 2
MADRFPLVSAIMPAYNYARYLPEALDSALGQDYPSDKLEIVVVDDGSSDETPEILAEYAARHPRQLRVIRQENAGNIVATNRALSHAQGEILALLDADDTWLAHKTRSQVEILMQRPEVGLVHGDMQMIDGAGAVTASSLFAHYDLHPGRGRLLPALMASNQATTSSIMLRAALRPYFDPIPKGEGISYYDWWVAARTAISSEIDYLGEPCCTYRIHGGNDTGGATGARRVRELRRELAQQRWLLAHVELRHALSVQELSVLFDRLHERALRLLQQAGTPFAELLEVTPADRARADQLLSAGHESAAGGDALAAAHHFVKAFAWDPFSADAAQAFRGYMDVAVAAPAHGDPRSLLDHARSFRTLAFGRELLERPQLLSDYARCFAGNDDATLVIWIREPELLEPLTQVVADASLDDPRAAHLLALSMPLDEREEPTLASSVHALLSERLHHPMFPAPHVGSGSVPMLRGIAERCWQRWGAPIDPGRPKA